MEIMDRARRSFLQGAAIFGAGIFGTPTVAAEKGEQNEHEKMQMPPGMNMDHDKMPMHKNGAAFLPTVTPDVPDLPFELDNGVKVLVPPHITAGTRIVVDVYNREYVRRAD